MPPVESDIHLMDTAVIPRGANVSSSIEVELDDILLDGQTIDIYDCQYLLGRGGMGVVYLARNRKLHRQCALKVLSPRRVSNSIDYIQRFENEGRAAAALVHPNVVTTHAIGKSGSHHFLEMEYVSGRSLQQEIDEAGPIGPLRSTQMAVGIADGLSVAHRLGIVHRDLKPDNVLVTPAGYPKIADFGLAKQIHSSHLGSTKLAGTPHFMAPELFDGEEANPASDVFALGVCYYLMLTGRFPFEGESVSALMAKILPGDYQSVRRVTPGIPLDVAECVSVMLARSPENRPRDGAAISQLLQAVLGASRDLDTLAYAALNDFPSVRYESVDRAVQIQLRMPNDRRQTV